MGRIRRTSKVLDKAEVRAAGLRTMAAFDFGNGLTTSLFDQAIGEVRGKLAEYNQALAAVDEKYNALLEAEKALKDLSERVLAGVAAKYGKDSTEYEQAGGVRKSERRRSAPQPAPTEPAPSSRAK